MEQGKSKMGGQSRQSPQVNKWGFAPVTPPSPIAGHAQDVPISVTA